MANNQFYWSKAWKDTRLKVLRRDKWKCSHCGASVRGLGKSRVDHIQSLTKRPDLALAMANLRTLCAPCDNARHAEKMTDRKTVEIGEDGFPIDLGNPFHLGRQG